MIHLYIDKTPHLHSKYMRHTDPTESTQPLHFLNICLISLKGTDAESNETKIEDNN